MFTPKMQFEPQKMWDRMASIYAYLDPADKAKIEVMWEALFEGFSALYYNISQATLSMIVSQTRGYLETSYTEVPLYHTGVQQTINEAFNLASESIKDITVNNSNVYLTTNSSVYQSTDELFLEEYGTQALTDTLLQTKELGSEHCLIGASGVYIRPNTTWELGWNQTDVQNITSLSSNQYFVRKSTSVGLVHHLLIDEPYYAQETNLPSSGIAYLADYKSPNYLYLGSTVDTYRADPNTLSWVTAGSLTDVSDFTLFNTDIYAATPSGIYSSLEATITWSNTLASSAYYLQSDGSLYTGTPTLQSTTYINTDTGLVWTGDKHTHNSNWYTGTSQTATSILLTEVEVYISDTNTLLNKNIEQFHSLTTDGSNLYASSERFIYKSTDGVNWTSFYTSDTANLLTTTQATAHSGLYGGTTQGAIILTASGTHTPLINSYKYASLGDTSYNYLSIPSLTSTVSDTILYEGTDYEIVNFDTLKLLNNLTLQDTGEEFYMISGLYLLPSIENIYFKGFGEPNPKNMLQNNIIVPYISGFNTITDHHQKSKLWANHLLQFCWASTSILRSQPTLQTLQQGYEIMRGLPFSYYDAFYHSSWTVSGVNYLKTTVSGTGSELTYEVKNPAQWHSYTANEFIPRHSTLVSGITAHDYKTNMPLIESLVSDTANPEEKYHIIGINESNTISGLSYSQNMLNAFTANTIPSTFFRVVFNRAPAISPIISGTQFYNPTETAAIQVLTSDPENDILTYRWNFLGPYTNLTNTLHYIPLISGIESANTEITVPTPLVDSKLTFEIGVSDTFNTITQEVDLYVSGTHQFASWGDTAFTFGDLNIDFATITAMNQS